MPNNYSKYLNSNSTHYISNSGSDERGKYKGGTAGDQTGKEWQLRSWYNRPWTVVLRYPDFAVGIKMAELGIDAALNDHVGYDQGQRTSYWNALVKANYDPSKITVNCEEDCTAGVTANAKACGYLLGIKKLQDLPTSIYSGNMRSKFISAGFVALTDKKYLDGYNYLLPGDVLLCEGHHAATNITYGKYAEKPASTTPAPAPAPTEKPDAQPAKEYYLSVMHGSYYVRTRPSTSGTAFGIVKLDTHLPYLGEESDGWYKVLFDGKTGWVSSKAGALIPTTSYTVKPTSWNIRSAPNATSKQVGIVKGGEKVTSLGIIENNWHYVYRSGIVGWISGKAV